MHEARGLFCKTAISGILDKIAGREKKHDRAETGQAQQRKKKNRGGGAGGRLTLGLGPSAERGRRIWRRKLGRRPSEAGPRGGRLGRPTRARSTEGAGLDAGARASWAFGRARPTRKVDGDERNQLDRFLPIHGDGGDGGFRQGAVR